MNRRPIPRRLCASLVAAAAAAAIVPAGAGAATTIGSTFNSGGGGCLPSDASFLQTASPSSSYAVPSAGVLTSWSYQASGQTPNVKLKVARATANPNDFLIVGESAVKTAVANSTNTYGDISIPVQAGDFLGLRVSANGDCGDIAGGPGFTSRFFNADPAPTTTVSVVPLATDDIRLDVSATLEADLDGDGLGDETEDADDDGDGVVDIVDGCPTGTSAGLDTDGDGCKDVGEDTDDDGDGVADTTDNCPVIANATQTDSDGDGIGNPCDATPNDVAAPGTTITKRPVNKSNKRKAKFTFESDEAGSTFACKLDEKAFKACSSPKVYKVKPGKHTFQVRAIDAAGNGDSSPAKARFKVVT